MMYLLSRYWNRLAYFFIHMGRNMIWDQTKRNRDLLARSEFARGYSEDIFCGTRRYR